MLRNSLRLLRGGRSLFSFSASHSTQSPIPQTQLDAKIVRQHKIIKVVVDDDLKNPKNREQVKQWLDGINEEIESALNKQCAINTYLENSFQDVATPDFIYGSLIYDLLEKEHVAEAYTLLCKAFFENCILDIPIYEKMLDSLIMAKFDVTYVVTLYRMFSRDFVPSEAMLKKLLDSGIQSGSKIAEIIMKQLLNKGVNKTQAPHPTPASTTKPTIDKSMTIDNLMEEFMKEVPEIIELKDKNGDLICTIEGSSIFEDEDEDEDESGDEDNKD